MPQRDRLRTLEVRVAGHDGLRLRLREGEDDERERVDRIARLRARVEHVEAEGRGDLVVPRPTSVNLSPDLAQQALDRRVDVLVRVEVALGLLGDLGEPALDLLELVLRQDLRGGEAPGVLGRRLAVVREELGVVDAQEPPDIRVESALDPAGPGRHPADYALVAARSPGGVELRLEGRDPDEALRCVVRERLARAVGREVGRVQHVRRSAPGHDRGVRAQLDANLTRDELLRRVDEGVDRFSRGAEPAPFVDDLRPPLLERPLEPCLVLRQDDVLERGVGGARASEPQAPRTPRGS